VDIVKGSVFRRCSCRSPDGRQLGAKCPELKNRRHGEWYVQTRVGASKGRRLFKRAVGSAKNASKGDAQTVLDQVNDLVKLAGDDETRVRIGDLIFETTGRGGSLPDVEDVRRRLGLSGDLTGRRTMGELLEEWFQSKKRWREGTRKGHREHLDLHILPVVANIPTERLNAAHIAAIFARIEERNEELLEAREAGIRLKGRVVGNSTQHRIYATVRNALNWAVRQRKIMFNPALGVELEPETRDPVTVYEAEQVRTFLMHSEPVCGQLALLYRIILLRGLRRGEAVGLRWSGIDFETGRARIERPILQIGGKIVEGKPKTRAGERGVSLDRATLEALRAHRVRQSAERLAWGEAYEDNDLVFAREDGSPIRPDYVSRRFKQLAKEAGLPVIRLHDGRHSAASLGLLAGIDIKIVSDQLGHSTTRITQDLYTHVTPAVRDDAAERVAALIELPKRDGTGTGS